MSKRKPQSLMEGALILSVAAILTKVIGAVFFKIPLQRLHYDAFGSFSAAYEIYTPIYTIATAGLPVATARMVSQAIANNRYRDVDAINKVAKKIFFVTGLIGSFAMVIAAFLIPSFIGQPLKLTLLIMAPAVLFSALEGAYRGVYEGTRNMYPTAITQIIESVVKLGLGLTLAYLVYNNSIDRFNQGLPVFGEIVPTLAAAKVKMIPYISAAMMVGVTVGALIAILYLMIRYRLKGSEISRTNLEISPPPYKQSALGRALITLAVPVALGALATQITNFIDVAMLGRMLKNLNDNHGDYLRGVYSAGLKLSESKDVNLFLNTSRQTVMTFVGLVPNITMTFGVSALPILTAAWESQNFKQVRKNITTVLRMTLLIGIPAGVGLSVLASPIFKLIFGTRDPAYLVSAPQMNVLGIAVVFICLVSPIQSMLQAMGRADLSAKIVICGGVIKLAFNLLLVPIPAINIMGSAYSTLISYVAMSIMGVIALRKVSGVKLPMRRIFMGPLIGGAVTGVSAWLVNFTLIKLTVSYKVATISAILVAICVYLVTLLLIHAISKEEILMLPKGYKILAFLERRNWI